MSQDIANAAYGNANDKTFSATPPNRPTKASLLLHGVC